MRVFARVADEGSITNAARALNTTQSAVSRQVAALEKELGAPLFHRTGRGVVLTNFGQRIAARVRAILAELEQMSIEASAQAGIPIGDVVIGLLATIGPWVAARLHNEVQRQCPKVRLQIVDGFSGELDAAVEEGRLDMALLFRYAVERKDPGRAIALLHSYLVGPRGDQLTRSSTIEFSRLSRLPLVLPRVPNGLRLALDHFAAAEGIELAVAIEASSVPIQLAIVAETSNRTYGVASHYAVADEVRRGELQAARIVSPGIDRTLALVQSSKRPHTLAAREVARLIAGIAEMLSAGDAAA